MHESVERLEAPADRPLSVWFEPWADGLEVPPGEVVELRAESPREGCLELDVQENGVAVYGWPGSQLRVFVGGVLVRDFSNPCPDLPPGTDLKAFVGLLFGQPTAGPQPAEPASKKPWWRFWH